MNYLGQNQQYHCYPRPGCHNPYVPGQNLFAAYYGSTSTIETDGKNGESKTAAWENDNYTITFDDSSSKMKICNKHTGETYTVSGDPHLYIGDKDEPGSNKHVSDFYNDGVITLDDGTQIHMDTIKSKTGNWQNMTVLDKVTIIEPNANKATQISNLDLDDKCNLEVKCGSIHEICGWNGGGTGVDYSTALKFKEAFGEKPGLYVLGADGKPNLITSETDLADGKELIKHIEEELNKNGYGDAGSIIGGCKPGYMHKLVQYILQQYLQQICHMFGNNAGVSPFGGSGNFGQQYAHLGATQSFGQGIQNFMKPQFTVPGFINANNVYGLMQASTIWDKTNTAMAQYMNSIGTNINYMPPNILNMGFHGGGGLNMICGFGGYGGMMGQGHIPHSWLR
ncbi:DUF1521 domain-containing protein [Veronia pacifica]|uniref:DUF1521 domain-containing protein n=1 Tax=Veronia pacifica TaxID=1080227 RepID=A0A1C3EQZ2_9GAMM|nr:DUF1521 domain-containing protein [Veronia pacifica]ODA35664.1 hypothetical protein A8L45_03355 [Veronia pacifica]